VKTACLHSEGQVKNFFNNAPLIVNCKKKLILIASLFTDSRIPFPIQIFLSQLELNLTGTPRLVEPRLERTIEAE
jgi:hypothetical protein